MQVVYRRYWPTQNARDIEDGPTQYACYIKDRYIQNVCYVAHGANIKYM